MGGDGASLAAGFALLDRLTAKLVTASGAFDADGRWADEGATSMVAWLRHRAGQTAREAGWIVRAGKLMRRLPALAAAWSSGEVSGGQLRAVAANVKPNTVEVLAEQLDGVLRTVRGLSVGATARVMQHWARCAEALVDGDPPAEERGLQLTTELDGGVEVAGRLGREGGAVVTAAVRLAESPDVDGEPPRTLSERRADALVDVCRWYLDHQGARRGGRHRPHLNVVVDVDGAPGAWASGPDRGVDAAAGRLVGEVVGGPTLDRLSVERLLCDAAVHRTVTSGRSAILDYGTAVRTVPAPLWSAVVVRDRHCRFPGCDRHAGWCEAHHVVHAADGGPTSLDNLVLLCTRHHHLCHRSGWQAELRPDGHFRLTTPAGRVLESDPPAASRAPPAA